MWKKIAKENLGVGADERFVVICDEPIEFPADDRPVAEIVVAPATGGHGREPHREVWEEVFGAAAVSALDMQGVFDRLLSKAVAAVDAPLIDEWTHRIKGLIPEAILAITHYSTSHTAFRRILTNAGTRYASMPLFDAELLRKGGPLDVDHDALVTRTRELARRLAGADRVRITAPNGTDLAFSVKNRSFKPDDGVLTTPGAFGNLPAGEVYCAPIEGTALGILVIENDASLAIENGRVTKVGGDTSLQDVFAKNPEYLQLCELGIGTNENASRDDNVLEEEKIMGTIHIAFGDNSSFGGNLQIPYHRDHVVYNPTVTIDGRALELPHR